AKAAEAADAAKAAEAADAAKAAEAADAAKAAEAADAAKAAEAADATKAAGAPAEGADDPAGAQKVTIAVVDNAEDKVKLFVCKYVGTPGVNDSAHQVISVSFNAADAPTVGSFFDDAQSSYALAIDEGQDEPSLDLCPPRSGTIVIDIPVLTLPTCEAPGSGLQLPADTAQIAYAFVTGEAGMTEGNYVITATIIVEGTVFSDQSTVHRYTGTLEATTDCTPPKKVFVCKFVGKPGVDEVLKGGENPISVSVNSIDPKFDGDPATLIGKDFADEQEFSRVIAVDAGGPTPSIADCLKVAPKTVVAEPPMVDPATCESNGRLILPTTDNVTYVSTPAGTGPGKYTVTATAGSGFTLSGNSVFRITVAKQLPASECVEPIVESIVEPQILPAVLAGEGASLPNTGGISLWLLLLAGPLTAAGLLVVMRNRPVAHAFTGGYGPRYSLTSPPLANAVEMAQTGFRKAVGRVAAMFGSLFGGRR
ncbi:MAG: hypothetical protein H7288_23055, partial [Kineosporiaceae bacterium]|nr:hypothetical protein [Aeromicrobium sp.]